MTTPRNRITVDEWRRARELIAAQREPGFMLASLDVVDQDYPAVNVEECLTCGALVVQPGLHRGWHQRATGQP